MLKPIQIPHFYLSILVILMVVLGMDLPLVWAKAPAGDPALLAPIGTTPVASAQEKILYTYTIRPGDTLWDIAKWVLKNPFLWPELLRYNYFNNPDLIFPGDQIIVPSIEVLERVKDARDVSEIEFIRQETEQNATRVELQPPAEETWLSREGLAAPEPVSLTPSSEEMVRMPLLEPAGTTLPSSDLKLSGRKNINFNYREYRGGIAPYYFSSGYTRQESLSLSLAGQLENTVKIEGEFYQSDQELENKYSLTLATKNLELFLGDYSAQVPDTQLILRDRLLSGARLTADFENLGGLALAGAAKGIAQYERFYGNRTQGPYYLQSAPVVFNSEKVMLNKQLLTQGIDYTIDYYTGQIRFLKYSIDDITLIEVVYESRQSVYARSLYASRVWSKPLNWLRWGVSLAREEDPASAGLVTLPSGNTLTPIGHWVYGSDLQLEVPEFGNLSAEWAASQYQSDRRNQESLLGQAGQLQMAGSLGPWGMKSYYSRTLPDFRSIGNLEQGTDLLNYGAGLDLVTGGPYTLAGDYDFKDNLLANIRQRSEQASAKASLRPFSWNNVGYHYFQLSERNDAPAPQHLQYLTRRHSGWLELSQDYWNADVRAEQEMREGELADRSTALTRSLALSANTKNLKVAMLSASWEHQQVNAQGSSLTSTSVYQVNKAQATGAWTPTERYSLTLDNRWIWDEQYGSMRTLDTKAQASPLDEVRLDAKYTWETLQSLLLATYQPVYTQTAAGQLEVLPLPLLSLRLAPIMRWTNLAANSQTLNLNRTDMANIKWSLAIPVSQEVEVKRDLYWLADTTDPALRIQTEQENRKGSYALRLGFSPAWAGDALAVYEQYYKHNYNLSRNDYDHLYGRHRTWGVGFRSSLQETIRGEGNYTLELRDQDGTSPQAITRTAYPITTTGQTTSQYDLLNSYGSLHTRQDTGRVKFTFQWTEVFFTWVESTYNRNQDLMGPAPIIHTLAPGLGALARWVNFRAEANARWAQSWGGLATRQTAYNLILGYNPADKLSLSLIAQYSRTYLPDTSSLEMNLNGSVQF